MIDGFDSALRQNGDFAGVFEYDGNTGFFYLYDQKRESRNKIVGYVRVINGSTDIEMTDVCISWNLEESKVGLFIGNKLTTFFDCTDMKCYGGLYDLEKSDIELRNAFEIAH